MEGAHVAHWEYPTRIGRSLHHDSTKASVSPAHARIYATPLLMLCQLESAAPHKYKRINRHSKNKKILYENNMETKRERLLAQVPLNLRSKCPCHILYQLSYQVLDRLFYKYLYVCARVISYNCYIWVNWCELSRDIYLSFSILQTFVINL